MRKPLLFSAIAYLIFVFYGSLVPLDFHPRKMEEAWSAFKNISYLHLGIGSRADWVANILLFIPLAFLWQGVFRSAKSALLLFPGFILLSLLIEFIQIFFPPRTVSLNDILAESMGAALGMTLWRLWGARLMRWLSESLMQQKSASVFQRMLWVYLAGLFFYNMMPLDLTISPVEIYHQWKEGKVVLIPFGFGAGDNSQLAYNLITDILVWIPLAFLWALPGKTPTAKVWAQVVALAVITEICQLFVYSRVSDITDIFMAALGAGAGVWAGQRFRQETVTEKSSLGMPSRLLVFGAGGSLLWAGGLLLVFWYPFDFHVNRQLVSEGLNHFFKVPFVSYYYGTEFRAITEVYHKVLFFMPMGILLGVAGLPYRSARWIKPVDWILILAMGGLALGIELGQVLLPGKNPDITDWALEMLGGFAGYRGTLALHLRLSRKNS